ncbi:MAG TPA: hypothetical protein VEH83_00280 [Gemmatimonadales bacterium]|nr:hypothetical protein [Gemmatimonadales bacterium]
MKRSPFVLVSALALLGGPAPARATNVIKCMIEAVADCDARFPPSDYHLVAIRGWCYMITTGMCAAS